MSSYQGSSYPRFRVLLSLHKVSRTSWLSRKQDSRSMLHLIGCGAICTDCGASGWSYALTSGVTTWSPKIALSRPWTTSSLKTGGTDNSKSSQNGSTLSSIKTSTSKCTGLLFSSPVNNSDKVSSSSGRYGLVNTRDEDMTECVECLRIWRSQCRGKRISRG